jgi:hypothetical protein
LHALNSIICNSHPIDSGGKNVPSPAFSVRARFHMNSASQSDNR